MVGGLQRVMEVGHLTVFIAPACVLGLDGDNTALHVVHVVLILFQGHRDNSDIHFLVNTLLLQTILQDVTCGVGDVVGHFHCLCYGLDGLYLSHFLRSVDMTHDEAEEPEEQEENSQAEKDDAHGEQGDTESVTDPRASAWHPWSHRS